nr:uncharacterized mitochondrial protein AtMg00810-like [Tanacetum cinerariifolium]
MFDVCACARHQVTPKECHLHAVKRIFQYLKGHPKLGLWYPKDSPFDLVAYSDSDYSGATQDRKSTTRGCQFLGRRLISWQCKKQTIVATSTTEAEYVAAASYCGQKDLSWTGLPECADDTVTDYSRPTPTVESSSEEDQNINPSVSKNVASPITPKSFVKFVKVSDSQSESPDFVMKKKACFNCDDFNHLAYECRKKVKRGTTRNSSPLNRKFSTGSRNFPTVNKKFSTASRKFPTGSKKNPTVDMGMKGKAIKPSACWTWKPLQNLSNKDDANILLRTPRQHNMYSIDLNNIITHRDLTCLVAKASADECMIWHRRLEAVNIACYVQNRVLVKKAHNKTLYELFNGRTPAIGFLKPFGCHVMILNTLDNLGTFEAKGDEGYFLEYLMSSKAFRVFNKRTKWVEENLHIEFLENKAIEKGSGPNWLFDIDSLTKSMNYVPVVDAVETYTATSTNPPADQLETLTVENPISTISLPVPTVCFTDSQKPSSETRLISKRVANQVETPSLDNILTLTNRFEDILGVTSDGEESNGVEADSAILYGTINEEVYVMKPLRFQDPEYPARKEDGIFLSRDKYVGDILKKFRYSDVRSLNTPMDKENPWGKDGTGKDVDLHLYRSMIRSLMYLTASRPDIMFAVCACSRYQVTPKECHLHAWHTQIVTMVVLLKIATSTTEAEYVAAASCCGQVLWIQN